MKQITLTEKRFFEWYIDDKSVTLRNSGGSYGGGSEVLIICSTNRSSEHCVPQTINGCNNSKSCKEN